MSSLDSCCNPCVVTPPVNIPGPAGLNAYTYTTFNFVIPATGGSVILNVQNSSPFAVGMTIMVASQSGGSTHGTFIVTAVTTGGIQATFLGLVNDSISGQTISAPAVVTPVGSPGFNAFTNTSASLIIGGGGSFNLAVNNSSWAGIGETIFVSDGTNFGTFTVTAISTGNITGTFLGLVTDTVPPFTFAGGAIVTPAANPNIGIVAVVNGGTGANTIAGARANLSAAGSGANSDITSLTALSTPLPISEGGTGNITALAALAALINPSKTGTFQANSTNQVAVGNTNVTANSVIIITLKTVGGTVGIAPYVNTINPGTGFTIKAQGSDTSFYNYVIIN